MTKYYSIEHSGGEWELGDGPYTYAETILDKRTNEAVDLLESAPVTTEALVTVCNDKELSDRLYVMSSLALLVSPRTKDLISQYSVSPDVRWIPTTIMRPDGTKAAHYFLGHSVNFLEIVDYAKSDCAWLSGRPRGTREAVAYVRTPVLCAKSIPNNLDLFMAMDVFWTCSTGLMEEITARGLTGFELIEIASE